MSNEKILEFLKQHRPPLWKRILHKVLWWLDELRIALGGWRRDLIWCPSQIRKIMSSSKGEVELYMRWRWDDPWSAYMIFRIDGAEYWTEDLFKDYFFCDEDYLLAEKQLLNLYRLWEEAKFILPMDSQNYFHDYKKVIPIDKVLPVAYFQTVQTSHWKQFLF